MNTPDQIVRGDSSPCPAPPRRAGERLPDGRGRASFPGPVREPLFGRSLSRRDMLRLSGLGLGALALEFLVQTEHNNHTEALVMFNTGKIFPGRPALGSWISYALGTETQNLPAYIVLRDPEGYNTSGSLLWQNGWLPATHRGTEVSTKGAPVLNLRPATPFPPAVQRDNLDLLAKLNEKHRHAYPLESELEARIRNYELAARMQLVADDLLDLSNESDATKKLFGLDNSVTAGYGLRCLMARRLVESG